VALTGGIAGIYLVLHWHPPLDWLPGGPLVWRVSYTLALGAALVTFWSIRHRTNPDHKWWKRGMFIVGLAAVLAFVMGGFVRERSRQPYTVYKEIIKPEVLPHEADRFLVYDKCLSCHHRSPNDLKRYQPKDWENRVEIEQKRPGAEITDEEARRIIEYLRENFR
jgi:hypothetical protein